MLTNVVLFETKKENLVEIIDTLSQYKLGFINKRTEMNIERVEDEEGNELYEVSIEVKKKNLQDCLTQLITMSRNSIFIDNLLVV